MRLQYTIRRKSLYKRVQKPIFIPSAQEQAKNGDATYPFRQSSHLLYLCGYSLPCYGLYINKNKEILFVDKPTIQQEIWDGLTFNLDTLSLIYGVKVKYTSEAKKIIAKDTISLPKTKGFKGSSGLLSEICTMRLIKDQYEIEHIQKACQITKKTLDEVKNNIPECINENMIKAMIDLRYTMQNCQHGFEPIVTQDGSVLHQRRHDQKIKKKQVLLIDTGCEYGFYSADITRCYPTSTFSKKQKSIYDLVALVHKKCINLVKPGVSMKDLENVAVETLVEGLKKLGILKGNTENIIKSNAVRLFYPHSLGHHVGLDTHDCSDAHKYLSKRQIKEVFDNPLTTGNVITIEPGLYFIEGLLTNPKMYKKYAAHINLEMAREYMKGVKGIRKEDTIIVTESGNKIAGNRDNDNILLNFSFKFGWDPWDYHQTLPKFDQK